MAPAFPQLTCHSRHPRLCCPTPASIEPRGGRLPSPGPARGFLSRAPPLGRAGLRVLLGAVPWKGPGYWGGLSCPLVARHFSRAGRKPCGCDTAPCQRPLRCWAPGCILPAPVSPLPLSLHWHSQCQDVSHAGHCWEHSAPGEGEGQTGRKRTTIITNNLVIFSPWSRDLAKHCSPNDFLNPWNNPIWLALFQCSFHG